MALRMALPKMGNSASASMRGLDCTESWSASSSSGCRARRSLTSECPAATAAGRLRPARRRHLRRGAMDCPGAGAWIPRRRDPGPRRMARSSASGCVSSTVGGHGVAWTAVLVGARYLELIGEPQRHFIEQAGQRGAIRLGMLQLLRPAFQQRDQLLTLVADGVGQLLGLLEKIVADFALGLRFVIFDFADLFEDRRSGDRSPTRMALGTLVALGVQTRFQRREFFVDERLQRLPGGGAWSRADPTIPSSMLLPAARSAARSRACWSRRECRESCRCFRWFTAS